jgi:OPT family oligopeptide transporter
MADNEKLRLEVDPAVAATEDPEARWLREVYKPNDANLTVRAVIAGILIGAVMCLSNLYVFFKTGWSLGVTLTACILAFGVFQLMQRARLTKPLGALENNALTTVASGAGYMTAGGNMAAYGALLMVLTPPLLVPHMWDALEGGFLLSREPQDGPAVGQMMIWFAVIAAMGVFVAIPIKRQLINQEGLAFPTGTATAETIRSLHNAGSSNAGKSALKALIIAFAIGVALKTSVSVFKFVPEHFDLPIEIGGYALICWSLYFPAEVVLIGAGALMSFRTGWSLLIGGIVTYLVLAPWLVDQGYVPALIPDKNNYKLIVQWTLWPGAAILVSAGLTSFALDYKALGRSFSGMGKLFGRKDKVPAAVVVRDGLIRPTDISEVEAPGWWFPVGFLVLAPIVVLLMAWIFAIPPWAGVLAAFLAILMGFVAARVTGETDITPTKALGPVTQMTFGALTPGNLTGNIMAANVTGGIGLHAADLLTTLKTGFLLGAKPRHQIYAQLFGVVAGAVFIVPAFRIIIPDPAVLGDSNWPAPSCLVWEGVSRAFANGLDSLHPSVQVAMLIGLGIGFVLAIAEKYAPKKIKPWVPSANGLGIAMVIPCANAVVMFLGALVAEILKRRQQDANVIPVASGLIAGESLMGIVAALLVSAGVVAK